jgi:hypothetical protein
MSDDGISKREILSLIARVAALSAFSYFTMKWLIDALDPSRFVHFFPEPIILNLPSKTRPVTFNYNYRYYDPGSD